MWDSFVFAPHDDINLVIILLFFFSVNTTLTESEKCDIIKKYDK
jgi:hypothetical protein